MTFTPPLLPPAAARQLRENGAQYFVDDKGDRLPSVTTILNATKPAERWEALANWRQRVGEAEANQITRTATHRGTGTHKQIQRFLQGEMIQCTEAVRPYWESIKPVLLDLAEIRLIEGSVFHYEAGYAGKVDCVASFRGVPCVCEWKTADRPKVTLDRLYDYPLQLVAYWGAVNHFYKEYGVHLRHALLVVALPNLPAEVFWFELEALMEQWQAWENRLTTYQQRQKWR